MPNGTFSIITQGTGTSISGISIGPDSVSYTMNVTNNNATNQTYVASSTIGGTSTGTVNNRTVSISESGFLGNQVEGAATITRISVAGNVLGNTQLNYTTGTPDSGGGGGTPPDSGGGGGGGTPTPAPSFTDSTVAAGILGKLYSDGVTASNTTSFAIASGSLPLGLSLNTGNGAITGTPTQQGSFSFAINAVGGGGTTSSGNLTIQVLPAGNRRNDLGFDINLANAKRYDGTSWVNLSNMKRFDGTNWINISN